MNGSLTPPDGLWTVTHTLAELRRRVYEALNCIELALSDEYEESVLALDSIRRMELVAEVLHELRSTAAPVPSGTDLGAMRGLFDVLHHSLILSEPPAHEAQRLELETAKSGT